jgi:surface protein
VADFVITIDTERTGSSDDDQFSMLIGGTVDVDWGDSSTSTSVTGRQTHTYASAGQYSVSISGAISSLNAEFNDNDRNKIIDVEAWGDESAWTSMYSMFRSSAGLGELTATDIPDVSGVTSMSNMFDGASSFTSDLSLWDVSGVTNMSSMFSGASAFTSNLSSWDVSGVTDMSSMFHNASSFTSAHYGLTLIGWSGLTLKSSVTLGAAGVYYCSTAATARQSIIDDFSWTITDAGSSGVECPAGGISFLRPHFKYGA